MNQHPDMSPFAVQFDIVSGLAAGLGPTQRRLSQMRGMYWDEPAYDRLLQEGDAVVYEFYELNMPATPTDLLFGTSILYPGKVGHEFFMTKGHFHSVLEAAEVYYGIRGTGVLVMETPEGKTSVQELRPGTAVYVPGRHAHRTVNTGSEPLVTFFTFPANAGHDYKTIETKGFRQLVREVEGRAVVEDNPRWRGVE